MFLSIKFLKFLILGAFTWLFAFAQMYLYTQVLPIPYGPAYAITQLFIVSVNFSLARRWIFRSIAESAYTQGGKFIVAVILFRCADWCLFMLLNGVAGLKYYAAIFLAMSIVFPLKYIVFKIRVFNDKED